MSAVETHVTKRQSCLLWGMVIAGLSVPVLPLIIVPIYKPGRYIDTIGFLWPPSWGTAVIFFFAITPFAGLAWFTRSWLSRSSLSSTERSACIAGIIVAFILALGLGFRSYMPQTSPGVNMWIFFFPFLAAMTMPIGYVLGHTSCRMIMWLMFRHKRVG